MSVAVQTSPARAGAGAGAARVRIVEAGAQDADREGDPAEGSKEGQEG